jgi:hypothetical protein
VLDQANGSERNEPPRPLADGPSAWTGAAVRSQPETLTFTPTAERLDMALQPAVAAEFTVPGRNCTHRTSRPDPGAH